MKKEKTNKPENELSDVENAIMILQKEEQRIDEEFKQAYIELCNKFQREIIPESRLIIVKKQIT